MRLLRKLLNTVHDGFNRYPDGTTAIVINDEDSSLVIDIADDAFVITQNGFETVNVAIDSTVTIQDVFDQVVSVYPTSTRAAGVAGMPARLLVESVRTYNKDTGIYTHTIDAYQSFLFVVFDMYSLVLGYAKQAVVDMLEQLYLHTATNWLDEWGGYFGVARQLNEADDDYRKRIIAEIIKPKCNNIAMEKAIFERFEQEITITNSISVHTWFKATTGFDLLGSLSLDDYTAQLVLFINRVKAAGTKLESLTLEASSISDTVPDVQTDELRLTIGAVYYHDGTWRHNGAIQYQSDATLFEIL